MKFFFLIALLLVLGIAALRMIPNILIIGEPGSGKSVGSATDVIGFPGARFIGDPHSQSLAKIVLTHATGEVLYDRIDDLDHPLRYGLLQASTHPDLRKRAQQNERKCKLFVEVLMRRRGGEAAGSPLMEEWVMALLTLFFSQQVPLPAHFLPFGIVPGTDEFSALVKGTMLSEMKAKFKALEGLTPRGLRSEVGSVTRLVNAVFRSHEFIERAGAGFDLGAFLQKRGTLIIERGDADEDVTRTIIGGLNMLITEHCERRPKPWPPVGIWLDECTNARTAGVFEEKKAGETRKYGLHWRYICQHPNFPNGPDGYFQNCQEKHFYRTGDYTLARKLAGFVVGSMRLGEEQTRSKMIDEIIADLMTFKPGWRWVVGPNGSRKEYVPMLEEPYPDWPGPPGKPGLRAAKLEEKLCRIYSRPEYRTQEVPNPGAPSATPASDSSTDTLPPPTNSPGTPSVDSPAERWKRKRKNPADGSPDSDCSAT